MTRVRNGWLPATLLAIAALACGCDDGPLPGTADAVEAAARAAADDAVGQVLSGFGGGPSTVAVLPLEADADGQVHAFVEHALIQSGRDRGLSVVTRSDAEWQRLMAEFVFTEDNFDIMPEAQLRRFGSVLGADAIVWGRVRSLGVDDTELKGRARVELRMGVVETGEIAGSGIGVGVAAIDPETLGVGVLLALSRQPWLLAAVIVGVVAGVVLLVLWVSIRRRAALALKPREIVR